MILVNLLPHREAARKHRREVFFGTLGLAALVGILIGGAIYSWYLAEIEAQQGKNLYLSNENKRLDGQIKDIAGLQAEIAALRARQGAVEDLQGNRNLPVYLLSELVKQLPDGVYINSMRQENQIVLMTGVAQSNERVSELLRNLANNSPWLTKPELVEITAGTVALSARDQRRVSNFSMRVTLRRATDPAPPGTAVSAPVASVVVVPSPAVKVPVSPLPAASASSAPAVPSPAPVPAKV